MVASRKQLHRLRMAPLPHILIEIDWFYNIISSIRFQLKLTIFDNSIIIINVTALYLVSGRG